MFIHFLILSFTFNITQTNFIMNIDVILHAHHLHYGKNCYCISCDCLFDSIAYLLHYSQTSIQLRQQCMNHFYICTQNPSHSLQEMYSNYFNPTFLFEDHKITSIQAYIHKMSISANDGGFWGNNRAIYSLAFNLKKPICIWLKNNMSICLSVGEEFISSQPFLFSLKHILF